MFRELRVHVAGKLRQPGLVYSCAYGGPDGEVLTGNENRPQTERDSLRMKRIAAQKSAGDYRFTAITGILATHLE